MKTTHSRYFGSAMAALFMAGIVCTPAVAGASEEGRRNTTLALGALTGYLFTRGGNKTPAFLGLGATAYAYKRYQDKINARHRRERIARARYFRSWQYRATQRRYRY
jgi:hypothetical protein